MMETKQATCAERIAEEMKDREEYLQSLQNRAEEDENCNDYEEIYELALSVDTKKLTTVCLSWGGPADYLDILWTEKDGIFTVTYRFEDWFDSAERKVQEGSALWQYAEMIIEAEGAY